MKKKSSTKATTTKTAKVQGSKIVPVEPKPKRKYTRRAKPGRKPGRKAKSEVRDAIAIAFELGRVVGRMESQ